MGVSETERDKPMPNGFMVGEWMVWPSRNLLVRGDQHIRVEPRAMNVLVCLAERGDQLATKEDLIERVWEGRSVTDDALTVTIYALRKALGDVARRPRYIETVSRRGYRLMAPVQMLMAAPESTSAPVEAPARYRSYFWRGTAAMIALLVVAAGALWTFKYSRHRRHVPSAEAHEAYLKGRYFLDQRSISGWRQALEQFERAVALDPGDPAAQAGLADTYTAMSDFGVASPAEMRPQAMEAARRALELDPESAAGLAALGRAQFLFDWDFAAAERNLARAVALDPNYMPAHQSMAWLKSARGQYPEAAAAAERALQLDPVNIARYTELAWVLALGGRQGDAMAETERALQLNPQSFETRLFKGWLYELAGQPDEAFASYREALRIGGASKESIDRIEAVYSAEGLPGYYRNWLNRRSGNTPMSDTWRARLYMRVGQPDRAIEALVHAYEKREGALAWVNVEPSFQALRSDPRFQQIAAQVGPQK